MEIYLYNKERGTYIDIKERKKRKREIRKRDKKIGHLIYISTMVCKITKIQNTEVKYILIS